MKKKIIITALIVLCMVFVFVMGVAFGNNQRKDSGSANDKDSKKDKTKVADISNFKKWKPNLVTINGKKYDLSEDIQKTIGAMVKDGIEVYESGGSYRLYDENGRIIRRSGGIEIAGKKGYYFEVTETDTTAGLISLYDDLETFSEEHGYFITKIYRFEPNNYYATEHMDFVSGLGISSAKDIEKMVNQKILIETDEGRIRLSNHSYTAVFVNGKPLDFAAYEDDLEELKNAPKATRYPIFIFDRFIPHLSAFRFSSFISDYYKCISTYDELKEHHSKRSHNTLDEELLIHFAMEDAYQQLEDGKTDSIILVSFDLNEENEFVGMFYNEYYFDADRTWSRDKFRPED